MKLMRNILFAMFVFGAFFARAQRSLVYSHENSDFKRAKQLFDQKKYVSAQRKFKVVFNRIDEPHSEVKMNAEYYVALCALELFNKDAEYLFIKFIENHPQSPKVRKARFQLGKYNYRKKRYTTTIKWFKQVDENDLEVAELPEFQFKFGYSLFRKNQFEDAKELFHKSKAIESDYQQSAKFYFAHLSYQGDLYESAYQEFKGLENDPVFASIVPYYLTQIYYLQNKNEELVKYGAPFLDSANTKRSPEIARLVGEGYYKLGDYSNSIVYFEKFKEKAANIDTLAFFQLGYSYYKNGNYKDALVNFQQSSDDKSKVGQLSMYYSGDCFLKLDNKDAARRSFKFAYKNNHELNITENSLFNYAKLSFELDIDPYHESIIALESYIKNYPASLNVDKARKILLNVYLNTKNYKRAINALDKIANKGPELQYAYQKIAYYRGIQEFNQQKVGFQKGDNSNFQKAIFYFNKSLEFPEDQEVVALAQYWKAESFYRLGFFKSALFEYGKFKSSNGAILLDEYKEVDYQLGYANLRLNEYGPSIKAFRDYINKHESNNATNKLNDAYLRTGDAYLILSNNLKGSSKQNELIHATKYYKNAIELGMREVDYGYFQLGQAYKLLNKFELEAEAFENLIFNYPNSNYIDDAKFKAGEVYFERLEKYEIAYKYFNDIVKNHTNNTALVQQSLNKMANIKRVQKEYVVAAGLFEQAVKLDPRTEFAGNALRGLRQTAQSDLNSPKRYLVFRESIGLPDVSRGAKDTLNFKSAKGVYVKKDYPAAVTQLSGYLNEFSNGIFINDANYMVAESHYRLGEKSKSLPYFEKVIDAPYGEWTEEALYKASEIHMENKDYQKAIGRFLLLEKKSEYDVYDKDAYVGLMNAYNALGDFENTAKYAHKVEQNKLVDNNGKFQAILLLANSSFKAYKYDTAAIAYQKIIDNTQKVMAAEALYQMGYIQYVQSDYTKSREYVVRLLKEFSNYSYWSSKGYLLLGDILIKQGDLVSAKYTFKSILEHYEGEELITEVNKRLDEIEAIKNAALLVKEEEEVIINIGNEDNVNKNLYDIEEEQEDNIDSLNIILPTDSVQQK